MRYRVYAAAWRDMSKSDGDLLKQVVLFESDSEEEARAYLQQLKEGAAEDKEWTQPAEEGQE